MEMLKSVNDYVKEHMGSREELPIFHVSSPIGWINDPNGFSVYGGMIHLFYQYHPYSCEWGPMYWGHCVTEDMVRWRTMPVALAPDQSYDKDGCFSGSAIEVDGKHVLCYTGRMIDQDKNGKIVERQNQCIAFGNGKEYRKSEYNPVITGDMLPKNFSRQDFRDPKVWEKNGTYYLIVGNHDNQNKGQVLLFSSKNLLDWKYENVLAKDQQGDIGIMWECPDFFPLGEKYILLCSPQNMMAQGYEFHNGHNSIYYTGSFDYEKKLFKKGIPLSLDYGMDFYAPQTTEMPDGRRVMIAWMKSWDTCLIPREQEWQGMMTFPRELKMKCDRLVQTPVHEIDDFRRNRVCYQKKIIAGKQELPGIRGRIIDLTVEFIQEEFEIFRIELAHDQRYTTSFIYHVKERILEMDRTYCGVNRDVVCQRKMKLDSENNNLKLRFLMDKYSIELFVNDGCQVATTVIATPMSADRIIFCCDGKAVIDIEKYDIIV